LDAEVAGLIGFALDLVLILDEKELVSINIIACRGDPHLVHYVSYLFYILHYLVIFADERTFRATPHFVCGDPVVPGCHRIRGSGDRILRIPCSDTFYRVFPLRVLTRLNKALVEVYLGTNIIDVDVNPLSPIADPIELIKKMLSVVAAKLD
jgi:hypothetical protein